MLTKSRTKLIKSLKLKKNRKQEGLFVIEGGKNVLEIIDSKYELESVYVSESFMHDHEKDLQSVSSITHVSKPTLIEEAGTFKTNNSALALARIRENEPLIPDTTEWTVAIDDIQDPGNLGTILRICDWYGITRLIASENSVDVYNPKVVNASMGSLVRTDVYYTDLVSFLSAVKVEIWGAFMDGDNVHKLGSITPGILLIGNESHGISAELGELVNRKITIPRLGGAESLNAAVATAVILDNLKRDYS